MTVPNQQMSDDLDAGWEDEDQARAPLARSMPPPAELEQLEAGWDDGDEDDDARGADRVDRFGDVGGPRASTTGDASSEKAEGRLARSMGKEDRRQLARLARAHQLQRSQEQRKQRKAARRELERERAQLRTAQPRDAATQTSDSPRKTKPLREKTLERDPEKRTKSAQSEVPAKVFGSENGKRLNRAARRTKSKHQGFATLAHQATTAAVRPNSGGSAFAVFMSVVVVLSALSYLLIR